MKKIQSIVDMRKKQNNNATRRFITAAIIIVLAAGLVALISVGNLFSEQKTLAEGTPILAPPYELPGTIVTSSDYREFYPQLNETSQQPGQEPKPAQELAPAPEPEPELEPEPKPAPYERFQPYSLPETHPDSFGRFAFANQIQGSLYPVHFGMPENYTSHGITTFRGNNFRNQSSWGTVNVVEEMLVIRYQHRIGSMERRTAITCEEAVCEEENCTKEHYSITRWTGVGWSGQPAIVTWDFEV